MSKAFSAVSRNMRKAADDLRREANKRARPFFGGLTKSGKIDLAEDTDAVQPAFSIGQDDNPRAAQLNRDITFLQGFGPGVF